MRRFLRCGIISVDRYCSSSATAHNTGLCEEMVKCGKKLTLERSFSCVDLLNYSNLSGDTNPIHIQISSAKEAGFPRCIVHGMLTAGLFPTIMKSNFPGAIYVSQTLRFQKPALVEDNLLAALTLVESVKHEQYYKLTFETSCSKLSDEVTVVDGTAVALLPLAQGSTNWDMLRGLTSSKHDNDRGYSREHAPNIVEIGKKFTMVRTFSQHDLVKYSELSGITSAGFGSRHSVHEILCAGLFPAIIGCNFPGAIYVSQTLNFQEPAFADDKLLAEVTVTQIVQLKRHYKVTFATYCFKEPKHAGVASGEIVVYGSAVALLPI